jgi:hypothetical protein
MVLHKILCYPKSPSQRKRAVNRSKQVVIAMQFEQERSVKSPRQVFDSRRSHGGLIETALIKLN